MKILLLILLFSVLSLSWGQLPDKWQGHYEGTLNSHNIEGSAVSYHMELIVSYVEDSTYDWIIIYGEDSLRDEREYLLVQTGKRQYQVDEMNTIVLSINQFKNTLVSVFEVEGNLIHVSYQFEKNKVIFELISSTKKLTTGNTKPKDEMNQNDIPLVYTYQTGVIQKAILKRIKF